MQARPLPLSISAIIAASCLNQVGCSSSGRGMRDGGDVEADAGTADTSPEGADRFYANDAALGDGSGTWRDGPLAERPEDTRPSPIWSAGAFRGAVPHGGYVDSPFLTLNGDRIYFLHSIYSASVLQGTSSPSDCPAATLPAGHTTVPGLEWNTDLYYASWNGQTWNGPINVGAPINTLGMECCMWVDREETEMIFYRDTDLDNDGKDGDLGLPPTGNYRSTRTSRNNPWGEPRPLEGNYGTTYQKHTGFRHDVHKTPSGDYYLWALQGGAKVLLYGAWDGQSHAAPTLIPGTENEDTQVWLNESETVMLYNHRAADATTELRRRVRSTRADPWGGPTVVTTPGFADPAGLTIWGEATLDESASFMVSVRFDTSVRSTAHPTASCWGAQLIVAEGTPLTGFSVPRVLNP